MTLEKQIQLDIINIIFGIDDIQKLNILKKQAKNLAEETVEIPNGNGRVKEEIPDFMEAIETTRDHIPLEEIYTSQNHEKIDFDTYMEEIKDFNWGDATLEELLTALKE